MLGAIVGDIAGSRFEHRNLKSTDFELFAPSCRYTDDSLMTAAVAEALLDARETGADLSGRAVARMQEFGRRDPFRGFGGRFRGWLAAADPRPYQSFGNGAAMRVSPCGLAAGSLEEAKALSFAVTRVSHDHPEGLKGAEAAACCVFLARSGETKEAIRDFVERNYYALDFTLDEIRPAYAFDVTCQGSVPVAIEAFLESEDFESAVKLAVSVGGDSDTIAAIAGGIAEPFWGIPKGIREEAFGFVSRYVRGAVLRFEALFPPRVI